jgi:WD40 repeat protein
MQEELARLEAELEAEEAEEEDFGAMLGELTALLSKAELGHCHFVMSVAWNNDGTKLASGSCDKTVRIWAVGSAGTFECQSTLSGHSDR